jgi:hypothetical protein
VRVDLVERAVPAGVDGDHDTLAAELLGGGANKVRVLHGDGVQADFICARVQNGADVVQRADAPADGEGDKHLLGDAGGEFEHGRASLVAGGDVQKHQLVRTFAVVQARQRYGVARVAQAHKLHTLDHPPVLDVQAGDDASRLGGHATAPRSGVATGRR